MPGDFNKRAYPLGHADIDLHMLKNSITTRLG